MDDLLSMLGTGSDNVFEWLLKMVGCNEGDDDNDVDVVVIGINVDEMVSLNPRYG